MKSEPENYAVYFSIIVRPSKFFQKSFTLKNLINATGCNKTYQQLTFNTGAYIGHPSTWFSSRTRRCVESLATFTNLCQVTEIILIIPVTVIRSWHFNSLLANTSGRSKSTIFNYKSTMSIYNKSCDNCYNFSISTLYNVLHQRLMTMFVGVVTLCYQLPQTRSESFD